MEILSHREPSSITEIEEPSVSVVEKFYDRWKTNSSYSRYISQEKYLEKLFKNDDTNGDIDMIFAKVCALNTCYSTRILASVEVATRIMELIKSKENGFYDNNLNDAHGDLGVRPDAIVNLYKRQNLSPCNHNQWLEYLPLALAFQLSFESFTKRVFPCPYRAADNF